MEPATNEYSSDSSDNEPLSKIIRQEFLPENCDAARPSFSSSDDLPLSKLTTLTSYVCDSRITSTKKIAELCNTLPADEEAMQASSDRDVDEAFDDVSDHDDPTYRQTCEVLHCKAEVFSSCFRCTILMCWKHFQADEPNCDAHCLKIDSDDDKITSSKRSKLVETKKKEKKIPEKFFVEGAPKEHHEEKIPRVNKKKLAKTLRNEGKEYYSVNTKKIVPARTLGPVCNKSWCRKGGRKCAEFSEEHRQKIFSDFNGLGDIKLQREFIVRFVEQKVKKSTTKSIGESRRVYTNFFHLSLDGRRVRVCRKMFVNTLGISDKIMRTSLQKLQDSGVLEEENRGGRNKAVAENDRLWRDNILKHINRFPRVESHYCRESSSREYLNGDLSISRMYQMFLNDLEPNAKKPCLSLYRLVFRSMNLSFHRPKKDQCGLCRIQKDGKEEEKVKIRDAYEKHILEKTAVRKLKEKNKTDAQCDSTIYSGCFDLQQVINLPISNDGSVFYKRRLSVFNLTLYDLGSRDCLCFTWHEGTSGRGASEIATAVFKTLKKYDEEKKIKSAYLFADGCGGQNKNSIMATALFYTVLNCENLKEISLRFFSPNHGQNEGDSAHSAINYAVKKAGDLFTPSQLVPVFRLARQKKPYQVYTLNFDDFLNFKKLSEDYRIKSIRNDDDGKNFKWTEIFEFFVKKDTPNKLFFKTSHLDTRYRAITIKRKTGGTITLSKLNKEPRAIPLPKYNDLMALCSGDKPVIRSPDDVLFYSSLSHTQT